jgi:ketosteroid isomerase-like protein
MLLIIATSPLFGQDTKTEKEAVLSVMKSYKDALQNLTTEGTFELFTEDSEVFESGGVEGTYNHYIEHHLGPELGHFEKFEFSDYEIDVKLDVPYAFTTETYVYTIVLNPDDKGNSRTIKKKGVATSILKKIDGKWKIIKTHSSSRNTK